jgi:long-subunit fatty acid transport protein
MRPKPNFASLGVWRWALALSAAGAVFLAGLSVRATPAELFGFGSRSQALAGTGLSSGPGFAATYTNPALLATDPRRTLALGWQASSFDLRVSSEQTTQELPDDTQAALFGVTAPLPFREPLGNRLVLGLGVTTPGATLVRVRLLDDDRPQFPLLGTRAEALSFNLGLGGRLPWGLALGAGLRVLARLQGGVTFDTSGEAARSVTDDELTFVTAPVFGAAYRPSRQLNFGFVYRAALESKVDLRVDVASLGSIVVPPLYVTGLAHVDPAQLGFEVSHAFGDVRAIGGLGYEAWSAVDSFKGATVRCPDSEPECGAAPTAKLDLEDTLVPRVALEWQVALTALSTAALRAGYFYEPTPFATARLPHALFDNSRHVFTAGYGLALNEPWPILLDLGVQWHELIAADPVALETDSGGASADLASATGDGRILSFALTCEVQF